MKIAVKQLLDLQEEETVVVSGRAEMRGGEMLVIDADGVYIRR